MNRNYKTGRSDSVVFFHGTEIEKTPAYGMHTLFVVGVHPATLIVNKAREAGVEHIYLGANKSFNQSDEWREMVDMLLHEGYWVTLDYPVRSHNFVMRSLNQEMRHSKFIPMISVEIPNLDTYNYNTVVKIDDVEIEYSNPGVWCHMLHDLQDRDRFTPWAAYKDDEIIK